MSAFLIRTSISLKHITVNCPMTIKLNQASILSVRWRKPRWIPKTQSKLFYVRKPTPIIEEEAEMLKIKYSHYKTHMKALRSDISHTLKDPNESYFCKNYEAERSAAAARIIDTEAREDQKKFDELLELNERWNAESALLREARLKVEDEKKLLAELKIAEFVELADQKIKSESQAFIDTTIKTSQKLITRENLDEEIEKLLNSRSDYNFAINSGSGTIRNKDLSDQDKTRTEI